ncbi:MAG: alpha-1,2-fucosyltransferase [Simkaniaceae bacterium]
MKVSNFILICTTFLLIGFQKSSANQSYHAKNQYYVKGSLSGQLGNQMFQIATALAVAWDIGAIPVFPDLLQNGDEKAINRRKIFFRLNTADPKRNFKTLDYTYDEYKPIKINRKCDIHLKGWSAFFKYFDHHREKILQVFVPSEEIMEKMQKKYADILGHPMTVGVHIRAFHPKIHERHPFIGLDYIKEAMDQFPDDALFVVCSCRINWCKKHLKDLKPNIIFIEGNDKILDLFLLSKCKHNILTNSTFSWWAGYLNTNPNKIVIAPKIWRPKTNKRKNILPKNCDDFLPKEWVILDNHYSDEPQWDIADFPTTSVCGSEK